MSEVTPECNENGCICRWCRGLTDADLTTAFNCVARIVFDRAGADLGKMIAAGELSMDPDMALARKLVNARFGGGKPS